MIYSKKINEYLVYTKGNDGRYEKIFNDFLSCKVKVVSVFRSISDTKVSLIETKYGLFVLKVFAPKDKPVERFFKSLVKKDYYENLFLQTERLRQDGVCSINDFYLLAERKLFGCSTTYVMLIEYIEGTELSKIAYIDEELKADVRASILELHRHSMVSGDPHKGNFIISNGKVRIIDLSGKKCSSERRAKDLIDLERHIGIKNNNKDMAYYLLIYKKKVRTFIKNKKKIIKSFF